ncbi:hypothetical protein PTKIN_Ptkin12aG0210600 [Pterospermum kingtungense]
MVGTSFKDWCRYFQYNEDEDAEKEDREKRRADARNALLVVMTLIAAVTFQAGVNPPGGVWQETKETTINETGHQAGTAVCASESDAYYVFLASNTLAFSAAVLVIMSLTHKFPFKFEVRVAAVSMIITYGSAVFSVTPDDPNEDADNYITKFRLVLIIAAAPLVMRFLIQLFVMLINREPEPPCLVQACVKPKTKTTKPPTNEA